MSEMIVQRESLTAIADEIRILSGTEGTMGLDAMKTNVSEANANVDTEADLIAQIGAALEGKAGGSDSGGSIDVCQVTFYCVDEYYNLWDICYYSGINESGQVVALSTSIEPSSNAVTITVPCNSFIFFAGWTETDNIEVSGGTVLEVEKSKHGYVAYAAPQTPNASAIVILS